MRHDKLGQLVREDDEAAGNTWVFNYDNRGNITSKVKYAYTTATNPGTALQTISYTYQTSGFKDILTGVGGVTYTNDAIGNRTSDGTWSYTWEHGRQLAGMTKSGTGIAYDYGADGCRISKAVTEGSATTTYQYFYSGGKLLHVSWNDSDRVHIFYNAIGSPISILYNGTRYYYVRNVQGDIVGLTTTSGLLRVAYTYDAWGNPLTTTGSMAGTLGKVNPLRYRGYVYDEETGLYYLGSRYYDPAVGRFINADGYITSEQGFNGLCLFVYCKNNPINKYDSKGEWTYGVSIGGNITDHVGVYVSIGYFVDRHGNKEIQISYAVPFDNETWVIGSESIGAGMTVQWTEADSVFDLHGTSMVFGVGGGIDGYAAGYDYIIVEDEFDYKNNKNGHQMTMGIGIGEDMHVMRVKTVSANSIYEKIRPVFDVIKEYLKIVLPFKTPLIWKRRQPHNGRSYKPGKNYVY